MLDIQKQYINYNRSARTQSIKYIVIHSTGNTNDTAQNNHDYFASCDRGASADFFVDDDNIIQVIDSDNYYSWHCGDGHGKYGITNGNSIGIEMCGTDNGNISEQTIDNTLDLVRVLMKKYNINSDHIVRHYDASKKCCPSQFSYNNWLRWTVFKNRINKPAGEWIQDDVGWWYKRSDGSFTKQDFEYIEGNWYYFDYKGYMVTGWLHLTSNNCDYLFDSNGKMYHDCEAYGYKFDCNGHATKIE